MSTNTYIVVNEETRKAVAIDIGGDVGFIMLESMKNDFQIEALLITHSHFDHIGGAYDLQRKGVDVYVGAMDEPFIEDDEANLSTVFGVSFEKFEPDYIFKDGEKLTLAGIDFEVIYTSGHTSGSYSFKTELGIFTGDALFKGSYGRVDFKTGNFDELVKTAKKLLAYGDDVRLYPGHGDFTTVKAEKNKNPIMSYVED